MNAARTLSSDDASSAAFQRTAAALDRATGAARGELAGPLRVDVSGELRDSLLLLAGVLAPILLLALLIA